MPDWIFSDLFALALGFALIGTFIGVTCLIEWLDGRRSRRYWDQVRKRLNE